MQNPNFPEASLPYYLCLDDSELLKLCQVSQYKGSGPGGQHRNKKSTGVRLYLPTFNVEIKHCDDRNTLVNQKRALKKLRLSLALANDFDYQLDLFSFPGSQKRINSDNPLYPLFCSQLRYLMIKHQASPAPCAKAFQLSTSALVRIIFKEKELLQTMQELRHRFTLPPLRP
jgi:hypothetical protein